jgi:hypothetical protein
VKGTRVVKGARVVKGPRPRRLGVHLVMLGVCMAAACQDTTPAPLPARALPDEAPPLARMVQAGPVRGLLTQPSGGRADLPGEVVLVDGIDDAQRAWAIERAWAGTVTLLLPPAVPADAAREYLAGTAAVGEATVTCRREVCP